MEVIYLLIPISLIVVGIIVYFLFWAIRSGQFDDLEGSGYQILMDDDRDTVSPEENEDGGVDGSGQTGGQDQ